MVVADSLPPAAPVAAPPAPVVDLPEDGEFETVWNGALGRQGVSLTSDGLGSTLGGANSFSVGRINK